MRPEFHHSQIEDAIFPAGHQESVSQNDLFLTKTRLSKA
ncbi:hypothetical protein T11_10300 [Trichinella zimbabwensis]|uniref:Uncharacterized protein n=1 Tax=Trichinella zimbabwensis TaxID=268475 RepID=A0A0V1GSS3_9BILA|nr:hypothetical protein T11_10300 [Trichinella zimbabwensis]